MLSRAATFLGLIILFFGFTITPVYSQTAQIPAVDQIDTQAGRLQEKQTSLTELEQRLTELERESTALETQTLDLEIERNDLQAQVDQLNIQINSTEEDEDALIDESVFEEIEELEDRIQEINIVLESNTIRQNSLEANILQVREDIESRKEDLEVEVSNLSTQLTDLVSRVGVYFVLILGYWVALRFSNTLLRRFVSHQRVSSIIRGMLTFLAIIATFITVLFAFVGNLNILITGVGLLSAALVVALQDFVSSFFAWIMISLRGQYRVGDVVTIDTGNREIYGQVTEVGFLRTTMREKLGGPDLNREQITGRTLIFPNNIVLRHALRNNNLDNRIIWHSMSLTVTFESDTNLALEVIQAVAKEEFERMVDHKDMFLDDVFNLKSAYAPKVYFDIAPSGPQYTIWFPAQSGKLRETLAIYSTKVLTALKEHGIDLAYDTLRVVAGQHQKSEPIMQLPKEDLPPKKS